MTDDIDRNRLRRAFFEDYLPPSAGLAERTLRQVHDERRPDRQGPHWAFGLVAVVLAAVIVATLVVTRAETGHSPHHSPAAPPPGTCKAGAPPKLIVVDLAAQQLTAYQRGCQVLTTPVTTGGPATEESTPTGTFHVLHKYPTLMLHSPWPMGSPHWFPDIQVHNYLAIRDTGLALHSAEWEPADAFGPGSEEGPFAASDRAVHVPSQPLVNLYTWADVGTTVVVCGAGGPEPGCGGL